VCFVVVVLKVRRRKGENAEQIEIERVCELLV